MGVLLSRAAKVDTLQPHCFDSQVISCIFSTTHVSMSEFTKKCKKTAARRVKGIGRKPKRRKIEETSVLPEGWVAPSSSDINLQLKFFKIACSEDNPPVHTLTHTVMAGTNGLHVEVLGQVVNINATPALRNMESLLPNATLVQQVHYINSLPLCKGNPDNSMLALADKHGKYYDIRKCVLATVQDHTIRHKDCKMLICSGERCTPCTLYRRCLLVKVARQRSKSTKDLQLSMSIPLNALNTPQKIERARHHRRRSRALFMQKTRTESKLARLKEESSVPAEHLTSDLVTIMSKEGRTISQLPGNNIKRLFWEQQMKAAQAKGAKSMRWHPLMIKWCLYLKSLSTSAYNTCQDVLQLPSTRTLRDYTHWMTAEPGIHVEVLEDLADKVNNLANRYVVLALDEMKIKEDLIYNKHTGQVIGFVNLGDTVQQLHELEHGNKKKTAKNIASHVLQFMVRALGAKLDYPLAHFSTSAISGEQLFTILWEVIEAVELTGLKVMIITADGASTNRKMFRLHEDPSGSNIANGVVYKTPNIFAADRNIYFVSDVPHLLKTTRNCWEKSRSGGTRFMQKGGQYILWEHLLGVYRRMSSESGLFMGHKLKQEHVHLTTFSRMRVDLAVQVLSSSVAKALEFYHVTTGSTEAKGTEQFVRFMDCFFDCFNVRSITEGKKTRKTTRDPYWSKDDWRFTWLKNIFLEYLKDWQEEVQSKQGYNALQRAKMIISPETLYGIRMTVSSFLEVGPLLLTDRNMKFLLTERFSQDSLESYFGDQRSRGHRNTNPTVQQYSVNANILRVSGGLSREERGNTRGKKKESTASEPTTTKLRKRGRQGTTK